MGNMNSHPNCTTPILHNKNDNNKVEVCSLKVIRLTDGNLFQYEDRSPINTKDLLNDFYGFDLYHGSSLYKPLHPDMVLHNEEVYYLRPSNTLQNFQWNLQDQSLPHHSHQQEEAEAEAARKKKSRRKVSFLEDVTIIPFSKGQEESIPSSPFEEVHASKHDGEDSPPNVCINLSGLEVLSHDSNTSGVRVKLVISKKQLSEIMMMDRDSKTQVLHYLLQDQRHCKPAPPIANGATHSCRGMVVHNSEKSKWKPSLVSISESEC